MRCRFCESDQCDDDCYFAASNLGVKRPTAAELRADGARAMRDALVKLREDIPPMCAGPTTDYLDDLLVERIDAVLALAPKEPS